MPGARVRPHRILNVDGYAPSRVLRTRVLQRAGYDVDEVDTAALAIAHLPDASLLLLDINLPDADGFTVCERVKTMRSDLPVVIVTSVYRTADARRDAFAAGADAYLLEPVEPARLVSTIQQFVGAPAAGEGRDDGPWVITDAVGHIQDLNPAAARLLNLSRRGAIGRNLTTFFVENRPQLMGEMFRASEGDSIARATRLHPRDRRPRQVRIDISFIPDSPGSRVRLRWRLDVIPPGTAPVLNT